MSFALASITGAIGMLRAGGTPGWLSWAAVAGVLIFFPTIDLGLYPANLRDVMSLLQFGGWLLIVIWMFGSGIFFYRSGARVSATLAAA